MLLLFILESLSVFNPQYLIFNPLKKGLLVFLMDGWCGVGGALFAVVIVLNSHNPSNIPFSEKTDIICGSSARLFLGRIILDRMNYKWIK